MEGIFPGNGILLFESLQQGAMKWIHCSLGSGVNMNISYLAFECVKSKFCSRLVNCTLIWLPGYLATNFNYFENNKQ